MLVHISWDSWLTSWISSQAQVQGPWPLNPQPRNMGTICSHSSPPPQPEESRHDCETS
jgi:hypothetical protein